MQTDVRRHEGACQIVVLCIFSLSPPSFGQASLSSKSFSHLGFQDYAP